MRPLLFSNLFPSEREPTRGVFSQHRFGALARHCPVRVVSPIPWWSRVRRPGELLRAPRTTIAGMDAIYPSYWSLPGRQSLHARAMAASLGPTLRRLRRDFPFDVILAAWAYPDAAAAARIARHLDVPLVAMVLGSDVNEFPNRPGLKSQIRGGLQAAARVVAVSGALRDKVVELGVDPGRIVVQHNCVDGERFALRSRAAARRELGLDESGRKIVYIGNWVEEKGVEVLVEAMSRLKEPDAELLMVGGGALDERLRARAAELGVADRVRFQGRRPHAEIPTWMAAADVLCLPSFREGCPNVVLEALASGRPVVASRVGGVPELLRETTGVLVPAGDPQALADGLGAALGREWDAEALRASVGSLSWDQYGAVLRDCLQAAIAEHSGAQAAARSTVLAR